MKRALRILAIDDDPMNQAIFEEIFSDESFELTVGSTCAEAIELANASAPDVLLLDLMLPDGSGYDVCRALRSNPDRRFTKIVLVSSKRRVEERLEGYAAGADDYLTKPFDSEELLAKVRVFAKLKFEEELNTFKAEIISLLCHETRTPLNSIIAPAEVLMSPEELSTEDRIAWAEMIYGSAQKLLSLNEKVLILSGLRAGTFELERHTVDLVPMAEATVGQFLCDAAANGVELNVSCPDHLTVSGDDRYLRVVLESLIDNAVRVSPEGAEVDVRLHSDDSRVLVSVVDRGPGIEATLLPRIFDEFVEPDVGHHSNGHGLSLAVSRAIVEHLGGRIHASSCPGVETELSFDMPSA